MSCDILIFSRNRPLQLHALLRSLVGNFVNYRRLAVLYSYDAPYVSALDELREHFPVCAFLKENDFRSDVLDFVKGSDGCVMFMVDDMVVRRRLDLSMASSLLETNIFLLAVSLRLGLHLNSCYMLRSVQPIPDGQVKANLFFWKWRGAPLDWGYPLSLDAHIFRSSDFYSWSSQLSFAKPNSLEAVLQSLLHSNPSLAQYCCCFAESCAFNLPLNKVQYEYPTNRSGDLSTATLLDYWNSGFEVDLKPLESMVPLSVHHPVDLHLVPRPA